PLYGPIAAINEMLGMYRVHGGNDAAGRPYDADLLRRKVAHIWRRADLIERWAPKLGMKPGTGLAFADAGAISLMVALKIRAPEAAAPRASIPSLCVRGLSRLITDAEPFSRQKLALGAWFLAAGLLPRRYAARLPVSDHRFWLESPV